MDTANLNRIESVPLKDVWGHEAADFTPWLAQAENLGLLEDALGMNLELVEREGSAGPYSVDLLCRDPNEQTHVVVENQLEQTDHDHLGKLLTYAAHFEACVAVWIARNFTEQHRAAVDWLNKVSSTGTRFFGLEIEVWRIGNSGAAPRLNVVASPKEWTKIEQKGLTATQQMQLRFWEDFRDYVSRNGEIVTKVHAPRPQHWLGIRGLGRADFFLYGIAVWAQGGGHHLRVELQIKGKDSDHYFGLLQRDAAEIKHGFDDPLEWYNPPDTQTRKIYWYLKTDLTNPDLRTDQCRWLLERSEALYQILAPRIADLPAP